MKDQLVLEVPIHSSAQYYRIRLSYLKRRHGCAQAKLPSHLVAGQNWHTHAVGQILHVLSGVGRYQIEGEALYEIRPGDTVVIPPEVKHWHGSSPGQMMCHLAMSESDDQGRGDGVVGTGQ